jgi:hypothetical protein
MQKVTRKKVVELVEKFIPVIESRYGISKHHSTTPYISLESKVEGELKGEYCYILNEIVVYWKNITGIEELIRTLIHEYQHYLQSPSWMTRYYRMGYEYEAHPYEVRAFDEEENWNEIWELAS